jgi:PKD repeat protein
VTLQLTAYNPNGAAINTFGATRQPTGLRVEAGNGLISGTPTTAGNYLVTATVTDGYLSDAETFTWTIVQSAFDTTAPVVTITLPTAAASFSTDQAFVTIGGTAVDDGRVSEVSWSSDRGVQGIASGTDNWLAGIPVLQGSNTITIRARDEAGNSATKAIVVKAKGLGSSSDPGTGKGKGKGNTN